MGRPRPFITPPPKKQNNVQQNMATSYWKLMKDRILNNNPSIGAKQANIMAIEYVNWQVRVEKEFKLICSKVRE